MTNCDQSERMVVPVNRAKAEFINNVIAELKAVKRKVNNIHLATNNVNDCEVNNFDLVLNNAK